MRIFHLTSKTTLYKILFFSVFLLIFSFFSSSAQEQNSSFKARLINIESTTKDPFRFNLTLYNGEKDAQMFSLSADLPQGWRASFKSSGSRVTAMKTEANATETISFEVHTGPNTSPQKYTIPVYAIGKKDTLQLNLEAVVQGDYGLELTTPSGKLSERLTEGSSKKISLRLKNTGTMPLKDIKLTDQSPSHWTASFEESHIDQLDGGESKDIEVTVKVPNKTIAGDYLVTFKANSSFSNAESQFRITVKTSFLSGWVGIVIILVALGLIFYLIRKYGRR